jgi:hypothetical protein
LRGDYKWFQVDQVGVEDGGRAVQAWLSQGVKKLVLRIW